MDFATWSVKVYTAKDKLRSAWMDMLPDPDVNDPAFRRAIQDEGQNWDQLDGAAQAQVFQRWIAQREQAHARLFPLNGNLMALLFLIQSDLSEFQRERFSQYMMVQHVQMQDYTMDRIRDEFKELFILTRTGWDNPHLRPHQGGPRAFCVMDTGTMDDVYGYWVEDDDTGVCGFLPEFEDALWVLEDEVHDVWAADKFQGRRNVRKGQPKGGGKGKGSKGWRRFRPKKPKGKGRGKAHASEVEEQPKQPEGETADW